MRKSALPIPLEVMPQNLQPIMVLIHCKATAVEVATKKLQSKRLVI